MTNFVSTTTVAQIVESLRESRRDALKYAESFPEYRGGWEARAQECLDQLREIDGTTERLDMLRAATAQGIDL